ncbi:MAG TPA: low-specificity L-threonine aldolase [Anaerolineae bacterium]|nr:low-specificity L-threonine aldolase [Anaerolineae bacterium]
MTIELRSDTFTLPTPAMRKAMASAEVGDDVYGEDPTVNELEALAAAKLGKEAALFVSSGTQGNLLALLTHCQRGDEFIAGQESHAYRYEGGGAAALGGIQPQPLNFEPDGTLNLQQVAAAIKADDFHFARTRLLCLENTQGGKVLPLDYQAQANALAKAHNLAIHLDGARIFNAAVAQGVDARQIAQYYDSVSVCLSKGLSAPVGTVLCGEKDFIAEARRWRKMLGGGMRQAGILAAAGILALTEMVDRLADDHANALRLAEGLNALPGFSVNLPTVQSNMLFLNMDAALLPQFVAFMKKRRINVDSWEVPVRLVTHYGVEAEDIERVIQTAAEFSEKLIQ